MLPLLTYLMRSSGTPVVTKTPSLVPDQRCTKDILSGIFPHQHTVGIFCLWCHSHHCLSPFLPVRHCQLLDLDIKHQANQGSSWT